MIITNRFRLCTDRYSGRNDSQWAMQMIRGPSMTLEKGFVHWVQEQKQAQAPLADKPIAFIANYYKPQSNERIGQVLNKLILVFAIVAGIAIITMLIL